MGNRLSKIYTRTGDKGTTGLSDGSRVAKDSIRIIAIGSVDELNSAIGIVVSCNHDKDSNNLLTEIQHKLFNIGGELSLPGHALVEDKDVTWLENQLDELNENLQPLKDFILPGGSLTASYCHLARSICRRAERDLITLGHQEDISPVILQYLNRLSDLLFVLARHINKQENHPDVLWDSGKKKE